MIKFFFILFAIILFSCKANENKKASLVNRTKTGAQNEKTKHNVIKKNNKAIIIKTNVKPSESSQIKKTVAQQKEKSTVIKLKTNENNSKDKKNLKNKTEKQNVIVKKEKIKQGIKPNLKNTNEIKPAEKQKQRIKKTTAVNKNNQIKKKLTSNQKSPKKIAKKSIENKKNKSVGIANLKKNKNSKARGYKYKTKTYKTKYITYKISKRVNYQTRYKWIKQCLARISKKLGIPQKNLIPFKMGRSVVFVEQLIKPGSDITYFFVHPNELTAYIGLKKHIKKHGGRAFLFIGDGKQLTKRIRYLIYKVKRFPFALDANRIYTDKRTIRKEFLKVGYRKRFWANNSWYWRMYSRNIKNAVWKISGFYKLLASVSPDPIVGVHDNHGLFWVKDIFRGKNRYKIASRWYKKRQSWAADFVYVIRYKDFKHFKKIGLNVILQNNRTVPNDGSMSVYFSRKKRWYMCIEVGRVGITKRLEKALSMLKKMHDYIIKTKKIKNQQVYTE